MSKRTAGGCWDISDNMDSEEVIGAFSKLLSGKSNYKTIIERKKDPVRCKNCSVALEGNEKFCPECGTKVEIINNSSQNKPTL